MILGCLLISCTDNQEFQISGTVRNMQGTPIVYLQSIDGMFNSRSYDTLKINPDSTYTLTLPADSYRSIYAYRRLSIMKYIKHSETNGESWPFLVMLFSIKVGRFISIRQLLPKTWKHWNHNWSKRWNNNEGELCSNDIVIWHTAVVRFFDEFVNHKILYHTGSILCKSTVKKWICKLNTGLLG